MTELPKVLFQSVAVHYHIIYLDFTAFNGSHNVTGYSLKGFQIFRVLFFFNSKRRNPILIRRIWKAKDSNFFGAVSKGNLPIPLQKVKLANKFCTANFINAIINTRNLIRICLWALIDFSKVCRKSKGTICSLQCVCSVRVMSDGFMITHINIMISSISPIGDIGKNILPPVNQLL